MISHLEPALRERETDTRARLWQELAMTRRSIRSYSREPVDAAAVGRLLQAAAWAPSAHNRQPWRFVPITTGEHKHRLAAAMGERLRQDRLADGDPADTIDADVRRSYLRLTRAPVLILVCLDPGNLDPYPDERRRRAEYLMAVQSVAMAMQNMLIAAHAEGLGACLICAPLFCGESVIEALGLPAHWEPQAIVTVGHPANAGKPASRKALSETIRTLPDDL